MSSYTSNVVQRIFANGTVAAAGLIAPSLYLPVACCTLLFHSVDVLQWVRSRATLETGIRCVPLSAAIMYTLLLDNDACVPSPQPLRARLQTPQSTYWDGTILWVVDSGNAAIRAVLPAQQVLWCVERTSRPFLPVQAAPVQCVAPSVTQLVGCSASASGTAASCSFSALPQARVSMGRKLGISEPSVNSVSRCLLFSFGSLVLPATLPFSRLRQRMAPPMRRVPLSLKAP